MADRKPSPSSSKKPASSGKPAAKRPPTKSGKSIVNQKQTPWGLIVTAVLIVVFAVGVIGFAVTSRDSSSSASGECTEMIGDNKDSYLNQLKCTTEITGVTFKSEPTRDHVQALVKYDQSPPVGGKHSQYWADCDGTAYPQPIANENAVHSLEHGAVWITYQPTLGLEDVANLARLVNGKDRMLMSPYPGLTSPISIQSWGYQLFVDSSTDPRLQEFIDAVRYNRKSTPEYGATCSQPSFKANPSTFGHPLWVPAGGASGDVMEE